MATDDWPKMCRTGDGSKPESERNVAVVALRNQRDEILMVQTRRFPEYWQPVGGGLEQTELPEDAARREVHEETDLLLEKAAFQFVAELPYDFGTGSVYCYEATLGPSTGEPRFNGEEVGAHRWVSLDEAGSLRMFPATRAFVGRLQGAGGSNPSRGY